MLETKTLPPDYHLIQGTPPAATYLKLRLESGLSPKTEAQATIAVTGSWYACHIIHNSTGAAVGMGRIIGDGGWYFHIIDMAVLPDHQRRGLGDAILKALLDRIASEAPPGAYVTLLADEPGRRLYSRYGFVESAPASLGMYMVLK